jgi:dihydrofolate synthase / folylpolyglutamate synthase
MDYKEAITFLSSLSNFERHRDPEAMKAITLDRMHLICDLLGNPQKRFRSILVAGTNGKGSVCAMIFEMLKAANMKVGLYTSPDLSCVRERIRIGIGFSDLEGAQDCISEEDFAKIISRIKSCFEEIKKINPNFDPTYFESLTAAAFVHFQNQGIDLAVCEVGLGGRLDATNVLDAQVCVISSLGLDHTEILGPDIASIAKEKAGIIKPSSIVISAPGPKEVMDVIRRECSLSGAQLIEYGRHIFSDVFSHNRQGVECSIKGLRSSLEHIILPMLGRHQAQNATLAVAAVEALSKDGAPTIAIKKGLENVIWPGRLEILRDNPVVVLDGAHNANAMQTLVTALQELWPKYSKHFLIGLSSDKQALQIGEVIGQIASSVTCTMSHHPRAYNTDALAAQFKTFIGEVNAIPDPIDAYMYCLNTAGEKGVVVVTGSLFLVGQLRSGIKLIEEKHKQLISQNAEAGICR